MGSIEEGYEEGWNKLFSDKLFSLRRAEDPKLNRVISIIKSNPEARILSIACGDFVNEAYLCKNGLRVDGIDISDIAVAKAKSLIRDRELSNCSVTKGDIFKSEFIVASYDAVMVFDFSMHLSNDILIELLNKIVFILKPNGLLFINFLSPEDDTFNFGKAIGPKSRSTSDGSIVIYYRSLPEIEKIFSTSSLVIKKIEDYKRIDNAHHGFRSKNEPAHTHRGFFIIAEKPFI